MGGSVEPIKACLATGMLVIMMAFVVQVLAMCFIRKALDWLFTRHELKWLDDIMPESHKREKEEKKKKMNQALSDGAVC